MDRCYCESSQCRHHADAGTCSLVTTESDNTRELGNVCTECRDNYARAGYPLELTATAMQARDATA